VNPELKFLNDVVKPWDELNALLVERFAFQPDLSTVTTAVTSISTAIKHQVDILALESGSSIKKLQSEINKESEAARLLSDVADVAKHVVLSKPRRQNSIFVAAIFEVSHEGEYRFLRNGVFVEHASLGRQDFMVSALSAIVYWVKKRNLNVAWSGSVREARAEFFPTAFLHYNPRLCINMASTRFMCFRRDDTGTLVPYAPRDFSFEVR
jgi:hypothetical protein